MTKPIEILQRESDNLITEKERINSTVIPSWNQDENNSAIRSINFKVEIIRQTILHLNIATEMDEI